jgi:hypothetical protein
MCSLCGILGANDHWADAAAREGVYTRNADPMRRRRERADRVRLANRVLALYGMHLSDWQGASFLLSTFNGKSEIVEDLGHLWPAAEKLCGRLCDPLARELLDQLDADPG